MSIDGLMIHSLAHELQGLEGGRINKIHQPTTDEIILQIRAGGSSCKLMLSANPTYPRVHLTDRSHQNPQEAPMFCMLLRKYCEGGIIESFKQTGMERILHMDVRHRDELGDLTIRRIVVEIMGRHSNIILMDPDSQLILDGIHHVTPAISAHRVVMPGSLYVLPPEQDKLDPLHTDSSEIHRQLKESFSEQPLDAEALAKWLVSHCTGMSPLTAKEIVYRGTVNSPNDTPDIDAVMTSFQAYMICSVSCKMNGTKISRSWTN
jgi:predicted ribosome quality control (RQC) complex YloA/Tae2 family protein